MLKQLMARGRLWAEALSGMDDPEGEYRIELDRRVRRLEAELAQMRKPSSADAGPNDKSDNLQVAETEGKGQ